MGIAHDPGIIVVGHTGVPAVYWKVLTKFRVRRRSRVWMSGRGGSRPTRSRARRGAAARAEDGAGAAAIVESQEGLSDGEIAGGRAALELVQASELGDEVKEQVANHYHLGTPSEPGPKFTIQAPQFYHRNV
eukprot:SAG11_NODE_1727_length_4368_cov_60.807683_3_plen_132_part_00